MSKRKVAIDAARRTKFLEALEDGATVIEACRAAGVSKSGIHEHKQADEVFAAQWAEAYDTGTEKLEAEARRRAVVGVTKPVYQKGEKVGDVQEYSDTLLIFLLKGRRPEMYRERYEVSGKGGGPVVVEVVRFSDVAKSDASGKAAG